MEHTADQIDDLLEDWFNAQIELRVKSRCITPPGELGRAYNRANDARQALAEALTGGR